MSAGAVMVSGIVSLDSAVSAFDVVATDQGDAGPST
jgi:hypothetical protein